MRWPFSRGREIEDRVDPELTRIGGRRGHGYVWFIAGFAVIAAVELYGYFFGLPTDPRIVMLFDAVLVGVALIQMRREKTDPLTPLLRAARDDSDQTIVRMLSRLQASGTHVVSRVPGDGFELSDVVICDRAVVIVQRHAGPRPEQEGPAITFDGEQVLFAGRARPGDPAREMRAQMAWLTNLLQQLTGDHYPVRGALLFPGWRVAPMPLGMRRDVWLIEPRALPGFIAREPIRLATTEVLEAVSQLRRFARSRAIS